MSSWFTRGWTTLELAKSGNVKVLFKSNSYGTVIKDLDEDILAKAGEPSSTWRQVATASIINLRGRRITNVNDILTALGPRNTSKPKDMATISGLLAGVEVSADLSQQKNNPQQETCQRILQKIKVFHGNLFHNSATMSKGFSWCPTNLLDMPLAPHSTSLIIHENGDVVGEWRVFRLNGFPVERCVLEYTHPLIKVPILLALKHEDKHLLLVELKSDPITRALLVKVMCKKETPKNVHCKFVGPLHFHPPLQVDEIREKMKQEARMRKGDAGEVVEVEKRATMRIGDTEKMVEVERPAWEYVCSSDQQCG